MKKINIIWTLSNKISLLRLALSLPFFLLLMYEQKVIAASVLFFASCSDVLDGYLARKMNQISDFGKIIDPLADKVFLFLFVFGLLLKGIIPFWFFLIIFLRDILILIGGFFFSKKTGSIPSSNYVGKLTVLFIGISLLIIYLGFFTININNYLLFFCTFLIVLSFSIYFINFVKQLRAL